jgi:hypothetical protein
MHVPRPTARKKSADDQRDLSGKLEINCAAGDFISRRRSDSNTDVR